MPTPVKVQATVTMITAHGDEVYSVRVAPARPVPAYAPGQFLHFALDAYDPAAHWPESRVFSIATSPTRAAELRITFAVKGAFTRRMADSLRPGSTVWLKLPYGEFVVRPEAAQETVLIAGCTGITPFVSFMEYMLDRTLETPVRVFYGARHEALLLDRPLIDECARRLPNVRSTYFAETPSSDPAVKTGRVSAEAVFAGLDRPSDATYYLSGPPAMIEAVQRQLMERDVTSERIRLDAWQ